MKVTVDPYRPISGILPKNKLISETMELDLNRNEIIRCTQFGTVYDEEMNIIDTNNIDKLFMSSNKKELLNHIETLHTIQNNINVPNKQEYVPINVIEEQTPINTEEPMVLDFPKDTVFYAINEQQWEKDGNHIILPFEFKILSEKFNKIGGNLYGVLSFTGSRPNQLEYRINDNWVKFNNKFANFSELKDGDEFIFRFIPKNNSTNIKYKISIKDGNSIIIEQSGEINLANTNE